VIRWWCCEGLPAGSSPVHIDVAEFGKVNGYKQSVYMVGAVKQVECFLGLPFAIPPTGNRRFSPPEPLPAPDDASKVEYDATKLPASCYQSVDKAFEPRLVDMWNPNTNMSENCLYLNIWKPEAASNKAVMVSKLSVQHIHGSSKSYCRFSVKHKYKYCA